MAMLPNLQFMDVVLFVGKFEPHTTTYVRCISSIIRVASFPLIVRNVPPDPQNVQSGAARATSGMQMRTRVCDLLGKKANRKARVVTFSHKRIHKVIRQRPAAKFFLQVCIFAAG